MQTLNAQQFKKTGEGNSMSKRSSETTADSTHCDEDIMTSKPPLPPRTIKPKKIKGNLINARGMHSTQNGFYKANDQRTS